MERRAQSHADLIPVDTFHQSFSAEAYCEWLAPAMTARPLSAAPVEPLASGIHWFTDRLFMGIETSGPMVTKKTKAQAENTAHLVGIARYKSGFERGVKGGDVAETVPGPIYVEALYETQEYMSFGVELEYIYLPKIDIGFHSDRHVCDQQIDPQPGIGQLVHSAMDDVFASALAHNGFMSEAAIDELCACLKIALGAHPQREDVRVHARTALYKLICRHIEENLGDPELTPKTLLRDFGVSRASLFRMFEPAGGVRNYIMERRAVRAVLDMSVHAEERGIMRRLSERWGFSSQPNFNRKIERMFGASPGGLFTRDAPYWFASMTPHQKVSSFVSETRAI